MSLSKFEFSAKNVKASLEIAEETVLHGMRRTRLKAEATVNREEDPDRAFLRVVTYPDLMAVSSGSIIVTVDGTADEEIKVPEELDFERYLNLPGQIAGRWEQAVYEINPHYLPSTDDEETEKKRQQPSSEDSSI
jgi:hypothetical protein